MQKKKKQKKKTKCNRSPKISAPMFTFRLLDYGKKLRHDLRARAERSSAPRLISEVCLFPYISGRADKASARRLISVISSEDYARVTSASAIRGERFL